MQVSILTPHYISPSAEPEASDNVALLASHVLRAQARHLLRIGATVRIASPASRLCGDDPLAELVRDRPAARADMWLIHITPNEPLTVDPREIRQGVVIAHVHCLEEVRPELQAADVVLANTQASQQRLLAQNAGQVHWLGMPALPAPREEARLAQRAALRQDWGATEDDAPLALVFLSSDHPSQQAAWRDLWEQAMALLDKNTAGQAIAGHRLGEFLRRLPAADVCLIIGDDDVAQFAALSAAAWGIPVAAIGAPEAYAWLSGVAIAPTPQVLAEWMCSPVRRSEAGRAARQGAAAFLPVVWETSLSRLLQKAREHTVDLPPWPTMPSPQPSAPPQVLSPDQSRLLAQADVMLRGYTVQSRLPVVGPWIGWLRRNLTSHLREPYLDPMIERQVAFNRAVAQSLAALEAQIRSLIQVTAHYTLPDVAQHLADRYASLLSHFRGCTLCHVVGIGDGALLLALRAANIPVQGCDAALPAAIAAQIKGFAVHQQAPMDYLVALEKQSCDSIILNISPLVGDAAALSLLIGETRRALRPGGKLALLLAPSMSQHPTPNQASEHLIAARVLLQVAGFIVGETRTPILADTAPLSDPGGVGTLEARLERVERAVFGLSFAPGWVIGQAPS